MKTKILRSVVRESQNLKMSLEYEGEKSATQSHPIDFQVHIGGIALQERVKIPFSDHTCEFLSSLVRAFLTK